MKNYEKPIITVNEEYAEGVYAASGDFISNTSSGCMTLKAYISQEYSQVREGSVVLWMETNHDGSLYGGDGHTANNVYVTLNFNQSVTIADNDFYQKDAETYTVVSGNGTAKVVLLFTGNFANAGTDFLGQIYAKCEPGIALKNYSVACQPVY